ncbi:unnamed protein product [Paramecium pentaurelia]|uniref:Dpy-30 motif protein n=1 Tax=Paramecium pentaurelia TaxID=43138 RepID=A0A8S1XJL5_9CILI|nr:unnamed protein product [Paramecium pentaurelia]
MNLIPETDKIDMAYLKSEKIGKVITKGLAELYRVKPQFPIEYLAKWLLNHNKTEANRGSMQDHMSHKEALIEQQKKEQEAQEEKDRKEKQLQDEENLKEMEFQNIIKTHEFHQKLLVKDFCNHLQKKGLTGVYVGYVDFPSKQINENDDDENAHLDTEQPKLIKYIGANDDHNFMIGQTLPLNEVGVTGEVFKEIPPPEEGQQPQSPIIYIPDVTKEQKLLYFKWKKLGAFLAIPLIYQSCLFPGSLDAGIEERLRFKKADVEKKLEKENKINEFNARIKEATETEQDPTSIQEELDQYLANWQDESEAPFQSQKRQFVVCFDTLGKDVGINEKDRQYFEDYVNLFAQSWNQMECKLLSEDIDHMIAYQEQGVKERSEALTIQEEQAVDSQQSQYDDLKDKEKEFQFALISIRASTVAQQIQQLQQELFSLKQVRVLKYPGLLLALMLFLNYNKENLLEKGTNQLDWTGVKHYICEDLIQKIIDYEYRGAKNEEVPKYAKLNRIQKRISKYIVEQVEEYNVCYAKILKWMQYIIKLRVLDIEIRREKIANLRKLIQETTEQVAKIKEEKEQKFEEYKNSIQQQEDQEPPNREEWELKYDEEHPLPKIPENVPDDVDNDFDEE